MYKILIVEDDLAMAQAIQKEMKMWERISLVQRDPEDFRRAGHVYLLGGR